MAIFRQSVLVFALLAIQVTAFPRLNAEGVQKLTNLTKKSSECPHIAKKDEVRCPHLAKQEELKRQTTFDPTSQHVSTTGTYTWVAPKTGDQRGPCPGLNALANHGYLPHNGVADIPTIVSAVKTGKSVSCNALPQKMPSSLNTPFLRALSFLPILRFREPL